MDTPVMADFANNLDRISTAEAFTFREAFPPPDAPLATAPVVFEYQCPAA